MPKKYYLLLKPSKMLNSIVTRLLLVALCIVIFGAVIREYALTKFLHEELSTVVKKQQLALATYVAHDIDRKITQRQMLIQRLAASLPIDLIAQPGKLSVWLKEHYEYQVLFSAGLFIVSPDGQLLAGYPAQKGQATAHYSNRDYIEAGRAGRSLIGRPELTGGVKEPMLPIAAPIFNDTGKVQSILVGFTALAAPGFMELLLNKSMDNPVGWVKVVFPKDKMLVTFSALGITLKSTPAPGINALYDSAAAGFRGAGLTTNSEGIEVVSAMVSVPSTGWFVVASVPSKEAFSLVSRVQIFLIKGAVAAIFLFAILSSVGLYIVFRHLFHAVAQADRMTRDEIPLAPIPVVYNDEIGHLITAFNRLLLKLDENQADRKRIALHDPLTGLPNRAYLSARLRQVLALAKRQHTVVALLFMDLDGFKYINDTLGHEAGDEVLRQVTKRFSSIIRESDTLARIGGDEFIVVATDLGDNAEDTAHTIAAKCIDALCSPFFIAGEVCVVGVSIGIALGDGDSSSDELLLAADQVMYQVKKAGRGRYMACRV
ncbi:diguanylate cyclase domain-containing protein [Pseudomonas sp. ML2-2023-3]|uniref:diguanylate cyclase domain-containing protein n=1 Tax=Pseudomonas sp. ML2-2023-3 TaxID=3122375 RepID=UPI0030CCEBC9